MTRKIGLLPFVIFVAFVPQPGLSRIFDCHPVLFPPPAAQGICGLSRLQASNKNEPGKACQFVGSRRKNALFHSIWDGKSTQPLWNRKAQEQVTGGQRCGKTRCVTRMTAK